MNTVRVSYSTRGIGQVCTLTVPNHVDVTDIQATLAAMHHVPAQQVYVIQAMMV